MCGENQSGHSSFAVLGAHLWAKWEHNPNRLGVPQCGKEINVATQPLLSWGPTGAHNGFITPTVLGVPNL